MSGRVGPFAAAVVFLSAAADAQTLGTRAAGMGEAFVAVADDATSVYWNPAGMATGAYLSLVMDFARGHDASTDQASQGSAGFVGFTVPPLGLAYYRQSLRVSPPRPEGTGTSSREDGRQSVQGLTTSTVGLTLAQSLTDYLVVAGTAKLVRGEVLGGVVAAEGPEDALDQFDDLAGVRTSRVDVDAGAMMAVDHWRVGLVARNLTTPAFDRPEPGAPAVTLNREVRAGAAWGSGWPGLSRVVVSADADLTRRTAPDGDRRDVAAGVETWWLGQRLGLRGGLRGSVEGEARPVVAGGLSAAVRSGFYVEAHLAHGDGEGRTWSVGARMTF